MLYSRIFLGLFTAVVGLCTGCSFFKKKSVENHHASYSISQALLLENVVPVAIVGSGPAGLTASMYVARAGITPLVFAGPLPRGQLTETSIVENWPGTPKVLGTHLMNSIQKQAESFGATIIYETITSLDCSSWPFTLCTDDGTCIRALSVIMATGAKPLTLGIPGEKEFWGKGVTTCAVCDATFFKDKKVVIVGGGDSAAEQVFELAAYASSITVLVRKSAMRAAKIVQDRLAAYPHVRIEYNKELTSIYGLGHQVTHIDVYDNKSKETEKRSIDGVFLAIGHTPSSQLLKGVVELTKEGYIAMQGRSQKTSLSGVFAAGEVQDPSYKQAIVAAGEGARAALDATSFLYDLGFTPEIGKQLQSHFFQRFDKKPIEFAEIADLNQFKKQVVESKGLVLVDFYSDSCPGCIRMIPSLEAVHSKLSDKLTMYKQHALRAKEVRLYLKNEFGIELRHLPVILLFKDGKCVAKITDLLGKKELVAEVSKYI